MDIVPQSLFPQEDPAPQKRCSKCKQWKPATPDYFPRDRGRKDGLYVYCKACETKPKEPSRIPEGYKQCSNVNCHAILPATTEYFHRNKAQKDGWDNQCKECKSKRGKEYSMRPEVRKPRLIRAKGWNDTHKQYHHDYYQVYNQVNAEHVRAVNRAKRLRNRERYSINGKIYYRKNRTRIQIRHKANYLKNREHRLRMSRVHYWNNKERYQERGKAYHQTPRGREVARTATRNYHARKKAIPGTHTATQVAEQLKRQKYKCYYAACGHAKFKKEKGKYIYQIEHTFPIARVVGTGIPANDMSYLVLACPECNKKKLAKFPWEWPEGGRLL